MTEGQKLEICGIERRVTVTWVDTTNIATWQTQDEVAEFAQDGGWVCRNTGWVSYEDDECVVVSARRSGSGHWGLSERIPRRAIVELTEEIPRLLFDEANEVLRSTHQVAHREQDTPNSTGWVDFLVRVDEVLQHQHAVMYPKTPCCCLAPEVNDGLDFHRKPGEHGKPHHGK